MSRLLVVSNRVIGPSGPGQPGAQGGLAGALYAALKKRDGLWFGWSGQECNTYDGTVHRHEIGGVTTATVDLPHQDVEEYYNGYANSTLWPLFHFRIDLAEYEKQTGMGYERVNARFADSLAPLIQPDDLIWVHDYHLIPLADRLRHKGVRNRIGFFLHTPWPPTRLFVSLPYHERLVTAMLRHDLIGFQTEEWLESFLHYCEKELGAPVSSETGEINFEGRRIIARSYPIGVDYEHIQQASGTGTARQAEQRILSSSRLRTAMIGVDRLDYSKGLIERLEGVERFLDDHPEHASDLVYIQIAPTSREDVKTYQKIRRTLERRAGHINGAHSEVDFVPIRYVNKGYSLTELCGFYRASKIGLVTPLRDGMNLVAKEYVAVQDPNDPGVLILSRFAGAARQLSDALLVNPHSPDEISSAIRDALAMRIEERKERWQSLVRSVKNEHVHAWASDFIGDLSKAPQ